VFVLGIMAENKYPIGILHYGYAADVQNHNVLLKMIAFRFAFISLVLVFITTRLVLTYYILVC